ncbi:SubName: Full=Uncharacterized protein {ECO:0000313/EMBL:CCA70193.1} [Serendipita indica DSM 11827]|uniref:F-box domain-containing protein n=1 Tax=Serendipita indica (strain DSM 11827) TaxID=1109443 RepID=G4TFX5_SERID|nr:SubName: Full=Uncharacterized protein {ECO:0000313/EMBL:CCA70193.1} [Serendipita indica DSM 11827]CCA70193.1 hypothetical protein PIIN_04132 [Serendipita indica DSM 11827]
MSFSNLSDDVLLEIGFHLDYRSLLSWSQASRRYHTLLSRSKSLWISVARTWDDAGKPLPLPVHLTEDTLTAAAIRTAIKHASKLHHHLNIGHFDASFFGPQPLHVSDQFPGSWFGTENGHKTNFGAVEGPDLALLILSDGGREHIRYIAIYQVNPLRKLAIWDLGSGDLQDWNFTWAFVEGRYKRLVFAASIRRPGWVDKSRRNSLEVRSLDIEDYLTSGALPEFRTCAQVFWKDAFTRVDLGDTIATGLVFGNGLATVITCLNWRTGDAFSIMVDGLGLEEFKGVEDYSQEVQFKRQMPSYAHVLVLNDWVGIYQIVGSKTLRCLFFPTTPSIPTVRLLPGYPPFRIKHQNPAVGCNPIGPEELIPLCQMEPVRTNQHCGCVHRRIQMSIRADDVEEEDMAVFDFEPVANELGTIDFERIYSELMRPNLCRPGYHSFEDRVGVQTHLPFAEGVWGSLVGSFGTAVAYWKSQTLGENGEVEEHLIVRRLPDPKHGNLPVRYTRAFVSLMKGDSVQSSLRVCAFDDAMGNLSLVDDDGELLWFLQLLDDPDRL